jgi:hypothetical protein
MKNRGVSLFEREDIGDMTQVQPVQEEKPKARRQRPRVLTSRDVKVLTWIGEMYTVRFDLLQKLLGDSPGVGGREQTKEGELSAVRTYKVIQKWRDMGLAEYRRILGDEPLYVWLTTRGLREVGLDYREQTPSLALIKHYHQVTLVRRYVELRNPQMLWKSERAIRGEVASFEAKERKNKHVPDGILVRYDRRTGQLRYDTAIEVELARKGQTDLEFIISRLAADYRYTFYFVSDQTEPHITRLCEPYGDKFQIVNLSKVLSELGVTL